jgi:hypothetical protein
MAVLTIQSEIVNDSVDCIRVYEGETLKRTFQYRLFHTIELCVDAVKAYIAEQKRFGVVTDVIDQEGILSEV